MIQPAGAGARDSPGVHALAGREAKQAVHPDSVRIAKGTWQNAPSRALPLRVLILEFRGGPRTLHLDTSPGVRAGPGPGFESCCPKKSLTLVHTGTTCRLVTRRHFQPPFSWGGR